MAQDVSAKVCELVAEKAMVDAGSVSRESTLEALGLDSLGLVELVFAVEEAFDIEVPFNANDPESSEFDIENVGSIIDSIQATVDAKAA